ncbi:hypothetical protein D6833_06290 [Candidatus Parcubacteria bacterium]|nr:MAG: hypothetical protein D6833_06290 [Candidatus Parcubacteria bacterium]
MATILDQWQGRGCPILLVAIAATVGLSCAHAPLKDTIYPPSTKNAKLDGQLEAVTEVLKKCQPQGAYAMCERPTLVRGLSACAELYRSAGLCLADLEECRKVAPLDLEMERGRRIQAEGQAKLYRWQRWVWAVGALAVGFGLGAGMMIWEAGR